MTEADEEQRLIAQRMSVGLTGAYHRLYLALAKIVSRPYLGLGLLARRVTLPKTEDGHSYYLALLPD